VVFVVIVLIVGAIALGSWISVLAKKAQLYEVLKPRLDRLDEGEKALERDRLALDRMVSEKTQGFPWLAAAWADYEGIRDNARARYLQFKPHPARKAAEHVREIASEKRRHEKLWRVLKYKLDYYQNLFPWLVDFTAEDADDLIETLLATRRVDADLGDEDGDPAAHWLAPDEYKSLPNTEKFQLALDRYWEKRKSKWEIGRDYERYIGYQYEMDGFAVRYQGIVDGFADLGRDLVAQKGDSVVIVQCKRWSKHRTIHEKHVFQLFGTLLAYRIDHPSVEAKGVLVTSTALSNRAKTFAGMLGIEYEEGVPLKPYPSIKCNVSRRDGSFIYHLPFDQQYDRTIVELDRGECYATTVAEAEELGFRRAFRWRGNETETASETGPAG
jgi:hypothetical protein